MRVMNTDQTTHAQRLALYQEVRRYGRILSDYTADDTTRLMTIQHASKVYRVCLHRGDVFALTIEGAA